MHPWLEYESGQAWCESSYSKYETVAFVAEFANTITNLPIIVLPMVNAFMIRDYISHHNFVVFLPHLLLTFNGLASTYYHATLNLFGQLVDELTLLWMLNIAFVAYMPIMNSVPPRLKRHVNGLRWGLIVLTTIISALCFLKPSLNAFTLMTFSVPSAAILHYESSIAEIKEAKEFVRRVLTLWTLAMSFWFSDKLLCDVWLYLGIPYLHAVFHLLSSVAAYNAFLMLSLMDIQRRGARAAAAGVTKYFVAEICYFPEFQWRQMKITGPPYIRLRDADDSARAHVE